MKVLRGDIINMNDLTKAHDSTDRKGDAQLHDDIHFLIRKALQTEGEEHEHRLLDSYRNHPACQRSASSQER